MQQGVGENSFERSIPGALSQQGLNDLEGDLAGGVQRLQALCGRADLGVPRAPRGSMAGDVEFNHDLVK